MTKTIIFDTDIISTFAKIGRLSFLKDIFSDYVLKITPEIYDELSVPLNFGYDFPEKIYDEIDVLTLQKEEQKRYQEILREDNSLDKGEIEALVVCMNRNYVFSSLDEVALDYARSKNIDTLSLHSILRIGLEKGIMDEKKIRELIKDIEDKDNTKIKEIEKIFE